MDNFETTNSARRLHTFLQDIQASSATKTDRFDVTVATLLGVSRDEYSVTTAAYMDLLELVEKARSDATLMPDETTRNMYRSPIVQIQEQLAKTRPDTQVQNFWFAPETMTALRYAAHLLSMFGEDENMLEQNEIDDLRERAEELSAMVIDADFPGKLKEHLVSLLDRFRRSVITYRIHGAAGIEQAVLESYGIMVGLNEFAKTRQEEEDSGIRKVYEQIAGFIGDLSNAINLTAQPTPLVTFGVTTVDLDFDKPFLMRPTRRQAAPLLASSAVALFLDLA